MKKLLSLMIASAVAVSFSSCKKEEVKADVSTVSTAYKVFLVESTQTGCSPCGSYGYPAFHETMAKYPHDVTMINLNYSLASNSAAINELDDFYGFGGTPSSSINHLADIQKDIYPSKSKFQNYAQLAKSVVAKAGIGIEKKIEGQTIEIKTKTVFFETVEGNFNLALYVVENGIMAKQLGHSSNDPIPHDYVFRGSANGGAFGKNIVSNPSKNQIIDGSYTFTLKSQSKAENIKVVGVLWKVDKDGKPTEMINSNMY